MGTLPKVLISRADYQIAGGVALRLRTQGGFDGGRLCRFGAISPTGLNEPLNIARCRARPLGRAIRRPPRGSVRSAICRSFYVAFGRAQARASMKDRSEIEAIRALLSSKPRPAGWAERRQRLDEAGSVWPVADDIKLSAVDLDGIPGAWSIAPGSDANRVLMFFHGGGYCSGSIASAAW